MRLQVIEIGNSKGIRIPQAILKQAQFGREIDLDVAEGQIVLRRMADKDDMFGFEKIAKMEDETVKRLLAKISTTDLMIALIDASNEVKQTVYRNLSEKAREFIKKKVHTLEKGNARDLIIERSRNMISEAFVEMLRG